MEIYFQWLTKERMNMVSVLDSIDLEDNEFYLNFKDGSRCNKKYVRDITQECDKDTIAIQIANKRDLWQVFSEIKGEVKERWEEDANGQKWMVDPGKKGKEVKHFIKPRSFNEHIKPYYEYDNISTNHENINETIISENITPEYNYIAPDTNVKNKNIKQNSPIHELCEKAKKTQVSFDTTISLNIPPISLFTVIKDTFDNGEDEFLDYVVENIDSSILRETIKECIYKIYKENNYTT